MAGNLLELNLARPQQRVGGAMMVPVGRLILLRSVPKSRMVQAMAYLTIPALFAPMVGPPIGGYITENYLATNAPGSAPAGNGRVRAVIQPKSDNKPAAQQ